MNTENTNCFIYETDELLIELLGGVRIEGLDRMRVTMKVSVVNRRHPQYTNEFILRRVCKKNTKKSNNEPNAEVSDTTGAEE